MSWRWRSKSMVRIQLQVGYAYAYNFCCILFYFFISDCIYICTVCACESQKNKQWWHRKVFFWKHFSLLFVCLPSILRSLLATTGITVFLRTFFFLFSVKKQRSAFCATAKKKKTNVNDETYAPLPMRRTVKINNAANTNMHCGVAMAECSIVQRQRKHAKVY